MFILRRPTDAELSAVLAAQHGVPLSYPEVGHTRPGMEVPAGYPLNRYRLRLGEGREVYAAAVGALRRWAMYDLPWTEIVPSGARVEAGLEVITLVRHLGFWSINPCRIVYVESREGERPWFAFALGTLPDHSERGEERFRVELDPAGGGAVHFDLFSFAGPGHPLTRAGYPFMRFLQKAFARAAARAVRDAVRAGRA